MSSNMINSFAAMRHLKQNWMFFMDYLRFKRVEPQLFRIKKDYVKTGYDVVIANAWLNRTSHDTFVPGSRYLFREEQIWEAMFATKVLVREKMMKPGNTVADIGTENSSLPLFLAFTQPVTIWAFDIFDRSYGQWFRHNILNSTKDGLFVLESNVETGGTQPKGTVIYSVGDATNMCNVKDNSMDIITCISTIEHILDDTKAMKELSRILKPKGKILITCPMDKEYSQARDKPDEVSWDIDRVYSIESIYKRLIDPAELKVYGKLNYNWEDKGRLKFIYNRTKEFFVGSLILTK